jgi:hypothetical protein
MGYHLRALSDDLFIKWDDFSARKADILLWIDLIVRLCEMSNDIVRMLIVLLKFGWSIVGEDVVLLESLFEE